MKTLKKLAALTLVLMMAMSTAALADGEETVPTGETEVVEVVETEVAEEVIEAAEEAAPEVIEEVAEEAAPEVIEEVAEEAAPEVIEEVAEEAAPEVIAEVVAEPAPEAVEEVAPQAAPEATELPEGAQLVGTLQDELNPDRFINIYASFEGDSLRIGDAVTLIAVLNGYDNAVYTIQWQFSTDNASWQDVAGETATSYSFTLTDGNCANYWRIAVIISDVIAD